MGYTVCDCRGSTEKVAQGDKWHWEIQTEAVQLHIDPDITPVAQPHCRILFHLQKKVEIELEQLLKQDIIEKSAGPTPWISLIVVAPKPKMPDEIRMFTDMCAANKAIMRERYMTPIYYG